MKHVNLLGALLMLQSALLYAVGAETQVVTPVNDLPAYCAWEMKDNAIEQPLCGLTGDASRGKALALDSAKGNCLACHRLPVEGVEAYGTIAPPLAGVASRLNEGQLRLRVVDARHLNPQSIMPGYYRNPELINRPARLYAGRTFLQAQEVEDVLAYLVTLP